jgi:hypothetical protein
MESGHHLFRPAMPTWSRRTRPTSPARHRREPGVAGPEPPPEVERSMPDATGALLLRGPVARTTATPSAACSADRTLVHRRARPTRSKPIPCRWCPIPGYPPNEDEPADVSG